MKTDPEFRSLIQPLTPEENEQLEASILAEGCRDALITWKGILLDGHHRLTICKTNSVKYREKEIKLPDRTSAKIWIIDNQLARRNLTRGQRIELSMKKEPLLAKQAKERQRAGGREKVVQKSAQATDERKTRVRAAKAAGVSHDTYRKGKEVFEKGSKKVKEQLRRGEITPNKAYQDMHRAKRRKEAIKAAGKVEPLRGKFRILYADPPWKYGDSGYGQGPAEFHYPTMSIAELCALPVKDLALDAAVLFMWVTSPLLEDAFPVINAWGFKYKASFVWNKVKHNVGHYNSVRHEFLLIATRGSCTPDDRRLVESVQAIERGKHSEKPERFREIIEQMYPNGPRVELFARRKVKGWKVWGNQV